MDPRDRLICEEAERRTGGTVEGGDWRVVVECMRLARADVVAAATSLCEEVASRSESPETAWKCRELIEELAR